MIVNELDIDRLAVDPLKANAVLIIHPNAVLPGTSTLEALKPETRKGKITERCRNRYLDDTSFRSFGNSAESPYMGAIGQPFCITIAKPNGHGHLRCIALSPSP